MAGLALGLHGVQVVAQGVSALADREQTNLQAEWQQEDMMHRQLEKAWREEDIIFRDIEKEWRRVDDKRRRVDEKMAQVGLLARLSALMGGFQVAMYINQGTPSPSELWPPNPKQIEPGEQKTVWEGNPQLHESLITIWAAICTAVIVLNFSIMIVASLIQLSIAHVTAQEGVVDRVPTAPPDHQYALDGSKPEGLIVYPEQFMALWQARYDRRFRLLMLLFSYGVPIYFLSLGFAVVIKFYMSPVAAWCGFMVSIFFMGVWYKYHNSQMTYLTYRPPIIVDDSATGNYPSGAQNTNHPRRFAKSNACSSTRNSRRGSGGSFERSPSNPTFERTASNTQVPSPTGIYRAPSQIHRPASVLRADSTRSTGLGHTSSIRRRLPPLTDKAPQEPDSSAAQIKSPNKDPIDEIEEVGSSPPRPQGVGGSAISPIPKDPTPSPAPKPIEPSPTGTTGLQV